MSIEAERALIGSLVIDPEAVTRVANVVAVRDFENDALRAIYDVILTLHTRGDLIDYVTICDEIEWSGALDRWADSQNKRAGLVTATINHAPTSLHVDHYATIVARHAEVRRAMDRQSERHPAAIL